MGLRPRPSNVHARAGMSLPDCRPSVSPGDRWRGGGPVGWLCPEDAGGWAGPPLSRTPTWFPQAQDAGRQCFIGTRSVAGTASCSCFPGTVVRHEGRRQEAQKVHVLSRLKRETSSHVSQEYPDPRSNVPPEFRTLPRVAPWPRGTCAGWGVGGDSQEGPLSAHGGEGSPASKPSAGPLDRHCSLVCDQDFSRASWIPSCPRVCWESWGGLSTPSPSHGTSAVGTRRVHRAGPSGRTVPAAAPPRAQPSTRRPRAWPRVGGAGCRGTGAAAAMGSQEAGSDFLWPRSCCGKSCSGWRRGGRD